VQVPGIERVVRIDDRLLVGSEPSADSIEHLHQLGVTVLLSVDARRPRLEEARRLGMRVVHLPIGYDTIPDDRIGSLRRLLQEETGPVYVHCHQGLHRGPAVASILWMLTTAGSNEEACSILDRCGTDPAYRGLWQRVRTFRVPDQAPSSAAALPEYVPADGLAGVMVRIDEACDRIAEAEGSGSKGELEHECLLLEELFTELSRPGLHPGVDERSMPKAHLDEALAAVAVLKVGFTEAGFRRLEASCTSCHAVARR
jgi:protein tyrosine phosphatase (PTP) superfamily phosphohydrolase (DUF442 family)